MKIRMKIPVAGTFHGRPEGVRAGEEIDLDDAFATRYCALHYAEPVVDTKEERAVAPPAEERAVEVPAEPVEDEKPAEPVKRGPGRPRNS